MVARAESRRAASAADFEAQQAVVSGVIGAVHARAPAFLDQFRSRREMTVIRSGGKLLELIHQGSTGGQEFGGSGLFGSDGGEDFFGAMMDSFVAAGVAITQCDEARFVRHRVDAGGLHGCGQRLIEQRLGLRVR